MIADGFYNVIEDCCRRLMRQGGGAIAADRTSERITPERVQEMLRLRASGLNQYEIAERMNVSRSTVQKYLKMEDVK